jgi:peptidoglycan/LPS O-acetylase OafA/YrhL
VPRQPLNAIPAIFFGTMTAVMVARALTIANAPYATVTHRFPTHLQIDSLFTGVVLSYYYHTRDGFAGAVRRHAPVLAAGAVLCLVAAQSIPDAMTRFVAGHLLTNAGFGALVVIAVVLPASRDWFSRAGARVGSQSYSIYLWHAAVMAFGAVIVPRVLGRQVGFYETVAWYVPSAFVIGLLMAKSIELPVLRLRDRWFPGDRRRLVPAAAYAASVSGDLSVEPAVGETVSTAAPALPR